MSENAELHYRVRPVRPEAHLFEVELELPEPPAEGLLLWMPAWIPGSYMIRDFARNLVSIEASGPDGALAVGKLDKQRWSVAAAKGPVRVRWQIYAWELTVRSAHLDRTHGYFNGPSLFLAVSGMEERPCTLEIAAPEGLDDWTLATSFRPLSQDARGFGRFAADDYDDLIDHPCEMGVLEALHFELQGVEHRSVIWGAERVNAERLGRDLERICAEHAAMFGELPIDRYLFLTQALSDGYGGLEHRFSTSLQCSRDELPATDEPAEPGAGYRRYLGLCSHEYFHLWNVKRIRPEALKQGGLRSEVHTRTLWAFEGITSYYDDLALVRSGCISRDAYLGLLAETLTRVRRTPGRFRQTLAESSFDAWTRFYKQDENAPNAIVSYYAKGALTALALDLRIRRDSAGAHSLDDLMRALWQRHGRTGEGVPERGIEALANEVTGLDLDDFFALALDSTDELELDGLLADFAVGLRWRAASGADDNGGIAKGDASDKPRPWLGIRLKRGASRADVAVVLNDGPGERAGLAPGDQIIAVDGLRVDAGGLDKRLAAIGTGATVELHVFRRDRLMVLNAGIEPAPQDTCELRLLDDAAGELMARREAWFASRR